MVKTIPIKDEELHTAFKIECIKRGVTITDAAEEAIRQLLAEWATHPADADATAPSGGTEAGNGGNDV